MWGQRRSIVSEQRQHHQVTRGPRVLLIVLGQLGPVRHSDGAGVLASLDRPGGEEMAVSRVPGVSSWTFGMRLCVTSANAVAIIDSVGPTLPVGAGYRFLGASARAFDLSPSHTGIISVDSYPPPATFVPDPLTDAVGYSVTTPCRDEPSGPYTELLVGLGVLSDSGGGWRGVDVKYTSGGRQYVLAIDFTILICGDAVKADCAPPTALAA